MRECSVCHARAEDHVTVCHNCGADLVKDSITARALQSILSSPRATGVFVLAPANACPVCRSAQGTYGKSSGLVPVVPMEGCSCPNGCACRYEPLVVEVGP